MNTMTGTCKSWIPVLLLALAATVVSYMGSRTVMAKQYRMAGNPVGPSPALKRMQQVSLPVQHAALLPETQPVAALGAGPDPKPAGPDPDTLFHVAMSATSQQYIQWQSRIMYYWYLKAKSQPGSAMGGFTRILHDGKPDEYMSEIPSVVVYPLPPGVDEGYVVINRPWAFIQWLEMNPIPEKYVLMAEPDHLFVRPMPNLALKHNHGGPVGFPFFYINPQAYPHFMKIVYSGDPRGIAPVGNSPVLMRKEDLRVVGPSWHNASLHLYADPSARKELGWVLEMYGFALACAVHGLSVHADKHIMVQPPFDHRLGHTYIIHYTYGNDVDAKGRVTYGTHGWWHWDKRDSTVVPPGRITPPPEGSPETIFRLVDMINEALTALGIAH
eukprot:jgi/Mesvir1/13003/Mv06007-RA.1